MEVRRKTSEETGINLIVIGLPIHIQDKIDKETVQSTNGLIGFLGQYQRKGRKTQGSNARLDRKPEPPPKKRPCMIYEKLNFPGRFHPITTH